MLRKAVTLASLVILFFAVLPASAFSLSPAGYRITADPGSLQLVKIKITNNESTTSTFIFRVLGAKQDEHGLPLFGQGFDAAESWVKPEAESIVLKPGEEQTVNFVVRVPAGTGPGGHYLGLGVQKSSKEKGQVSLSGQLLSILSLQVAGVAHESMEINKWASLNASTAKKTWKFALEFQNKSNIEVPVLAEVVIRGRSGKELARLPVSIGPENILANTLRIAEPELAIKGSKIFWPGIYSAQIDLHYGRTNQIASAVAGVTYLPIWFFVAIGLLIILLILTAILIYRKKIKKPAQAANF